MTDIHSCSYFCDRPECIKAQRDELRERLAQPEDDYWHKEARRYAEDADYWRSKAMVLSLPRTWVDLTDEEIESLDCVYLNWLDYERVETKGEKEFARAIESKLKEKNT